MENKKLLKFLFKDIAEIEELFEEKGSDGFDALEIEFIQSRFRGARQIIRMLDEKEDQGAVTSEKLQEVQEKLQERETPEEIPAPEPEIMQEQLVSEESEENDETQAIDDSMEEGTKETNKVEDELEVEEREETQLTELDEEAQLAEVKAEKPATSDDVELDDEEEKTGSRTIGDSFLKEKSVNDLMSNGSGKLENKLSNSPVGSIRGAIGINDRYQYIRELFDGSADTFSKTVNELDKLSNIQEAVSYLQQNYKWKKNETSLKFVNLVKRRFSNG